MLDKETCQKLLPLVNQPPAWDSLEDYLKELGNRDKDRLAQEPSDLEIRKLQGRVQLVNHLLSLKNEVNEQQKVYVKSGD
jgi:hypothetical protein